MVCLAAVGGMETFTFAARLVLCLFLMDASDTHSGLIGCDVRKNRASRLPPGFVGMMDAFGRPPLVGLGAGVERDAVHSPALEAAAEGLPAQV